MKLEPLVPYDWQEADLRKICKSIGPEAGALVVSAPGAGKTLIGVEAIKRMKPSTVLIIAPPSTHAGAWGKTLRRQGIDLPIHRLVGTPAKELFGKLMWGQPGVYITSAQWFTRQKWAGVEPDMVIIDEIHMLGKYGNKGQRVMCGYGRTKGLQAKLRIGLSGTPWRNSFDNAWAIARWIEPRAVSPEYWAWRITECVGKYDHFAPQNLLVTGEKEEGKLARSLTCFIAHRQRDKCCKFHPKGFLGHLAEPIRVERDLEMTKEQAQFYKSMEKTYFAFLTTPDDNGKVPVVASLPIVARGMLRFCALALPSLNEETNRLYFEPDAPSPKIDQLIADLGSLDGKRVLALTHSQQFAALATARVNAAGFKAAEWSGATTKTVRDKLLEDFESGKLDVIIGVISAMGTGTDGLQRSAYNVIFLSVDDDSSNNTQGVSRLDRLGQEHQVVIMDYRMENTFDVGHLSRQLQKQLDLNRTLLETAQ